MRKPREGLEHTDGLLATPVLHDSFSPSFHFGVIWNYPSFPTHFNEIVSTDG